jgi:hypothetical protein
MLARTARLPATAGELPDAAAQIVACFDGPFTATYADLVERVRGAGGGDGGIFADPYLEGPGSPRLALLLLRDAAPEPMSREAAEAIGLADAVADAARGAGVKVSEVVAEAGHPLTRLAGQIAMTDFAATYLALGLGLDPAVSPHVADLSDRTGH